MKDPKFGYHWIWMLPISYAYILYEKVGDLYIRIYQNIRLKIIYIKNPKIKELTKLSGIKK